MLNMTSFSGRILPPSSQRTPLLSDDQGSVTSDTREYYSPFHTPEGKRMMGKFCVFLLILRLLITSKGHLLALLSTGA